MKPIGIIPARSGSKGVPGKNKRTLSGRPLVYYSIKAALAAGLDLLISSDDADIIKIASDLGVDTSYKRPPKLSTDTTSMADTLLHAVGWLERQGKHYDSLVLLQPTSPFRTSDDIKRGLALHSEFSTHVIGVSPMWTHPYECLRVSGDSWEFLASNTIAATRRQDYQEKFYFINGAFYSFGIEHLKKHREIPFKDAKLLFMDPINTIDIDTELEFTVADALMTKHSRT